MSRKEILAEILTEYFAIGVDCYSYNLTRTKQAFFTGTITIEDFEEFDEDFIHDIAEHIDSELSKKEFGVIKDVMDLQSRYKALKKAPKFTKLDLIDLVVPFRDKYKLKDREALEIARTETNLKPIMDLLYKIKE